MSDRFEFIDAQCATGSASNVKEVPPVGKMCTWLGVPAPASTNRRHRPASATMRRRDELKLYITKSFDDSDGTYGYRQCH